MKIVRGKVPFREKIDKKKVPFRDNFAFWKVPFRDGEDKESFDIAGITLFFAA